MTPPIPLVPSGGQGTATAASAPVPAKTSRGLGALPHVAGHGVLVFLIVVLASGGVLLWPLLLGGGIISALLIGGSARRRRARKVAPSATPARTSRGKRGMLPLLKRPSLPGLGSGTSGTRKGSLPGTQRGNGWPAPGAKPIRRAGLRGLLPGSLGRAPRIGAAPGGRSTGSGGLLSRLRGRTPGLGGGKSTLSGSAGGRVPGTGNNGPKAPGGTTPGGGRLARLRGKIPGLGRSKSSTPGSGGGSGPGSTSGSGRRKSLPGMPKMLQRLFADSPNSRRASAPGERKTLRGRLRDRLAGRRSQGDETPQHFGGGSVGSDPPLPPVTRRNNPNRKEPNMFRPNVRPSGTAVSPPKTGGGGGSPASGVGGGGGPITATAEEVITQLLNAPTDTARARAAYMKDAVAALEALAVGITQAGKKIGDSWNDHEVEGATALIARQLRGGSGVLSEADANWQRLVRSHLDHIESPHRHGEAGRHGLDVSHNE